VSFASQPLSIVALTVFAVGVQYQTPTGDKIASATGTA